MKKAMILVAMIALGATYSCDDTLSDDISIQEVEMTTDPHESVPGCEDPKGCN